MSTRRTFPVKDYDLDATLTSGQAFRWRLHDGHWVGVIGGRWVALRLENPDSSSSSSSKNKKISRKRTRTKDEDDGKVIVAQTAEPVSDWRWLTDYLQTEIDLGAVLATFPDDEPMRAAVAACRGLRLLRQDPWECLASFILSSTKQIVQIQQIVSLLCERYGERVADGAPASGTACSAFPLRPCRAGGRRSNETGAFSLGVSSFPSAARIAALTEAELRACKMGFRAPYLLATARLIDGGKLDLSRLHKLTVEGARAELIRLPGVGRKIADCVLLFACGFQSAFPVDVWVMKALRQLYFPRRRPSLKRLHRFSETHFGPNAGYAQQYLFHYMRTKKKYSDAT